MTVWAVVVAAGGGSRFGGLKQFAEMAGRPLVDWSVEAARSVADGVVLVVPVEHAGPPPVDDRARNFWSFRPVIRPEVPNVVRGDWIRSPIPPWVGSVLVPSR